MAAKARKREKSDDVYGDLLKASQDIFGDTISPEVKYWLPSGIHLLDLAVRRGIPCGRLIEIYGREGSGKTSLALNIVKQAQSLGGTGVWLDAESGFSVDLAENIIGITTKAGWIYNTPWSAEDAFEAIEAYAGRAIESPTPTVIVLDSVAGLCPRSLTLGEESMASGKRQTGKMAGIMSWFMSRGLHQTIKDSKVVLIFLNQIRSVLDFYGHGGPKYTTPGGYAVGFYAWVRLAISNTAIEKDEKEIKKGRSPNLGSLIEVEVKKNRVGQPFKKISFPIYTRPDQPVLGIDDYMSCLVYLITRKVIKSSGGWFVLDDIKDRKLGFRKRMTEDPKFAKYIKDLVTERFLYEYGEAESDRFSKATEGTDHGDSNE